MALNWRGRRRNSDDELNEIKAQQARQEAYMQMELDRLELPYAKKALQRDAESDDLANLLSNVRRQIDLVNQIGGYVTDWDKMTMDEKKSAISDLLDMASLVTEATMAKLRENDAMRKAAKQASSILMTP